jgi:ribosomal protein S18 acetylase RimI-like enzyme
VSRPGARPARGTTARRITAPVDPAQIERLADAAWPAAEQVPLRPWKLRATHGVTRRANSVFTAGGEDLTDVGLVEDLVEAAEGFYARRSLPAVFQISAGTGVRGLDAFLAGRGYRVDGASEVWAAAAARVPRPPLVAGLELSRSDEPDQAWFDCAFDEAAAERRRVHEQIVRRVPRPRRFVSARTADGVAIASGMCASAGGHAGIFAMVTRESHRRRGIAAALLGGLCAWAAARGDATAYLQVMCENHQAKRVYRRAGFGFAYGYHYRTR